MCLYGLHSLSSCIIGHPNKKTAAFLNCNRKIAAYYHASFPFVLRNVNFYHEVHLKGWETPRNFCMRKNGPRLRDEMKILDCSRVRDFLQPVTSNWKCMEEVQGVTPCGKVHRLVRDIL